MEGIHDLKVVERKYACLPLYPWSFKSATGKNQNSKESKPVDKIQLKNMLRYFKLWNNIVFLSRFLFLQNVLSISLSMNITTASNTISDVKMCIKIF